MKMYCGILALLFISSPSLVEAGQFKAQNFFGCWAYNNGTVQGKFHLGEDREFYNSKFVLGVGSPTSLESFGKWTLKNENIILKYSYGTTIELQIQDTGSEYILVERGLEYQRCG